MKEIKIKIDIEGKSDVKKVTKDVKELDKAGKDTAKGGFKDMVESSGAFRKELGLINRIKAVFNSGMQLMGVSTATTATSTSTLVKGLRLLRVALIATGIGAIAVVVGTLATAFFSTQQGVDALNRVLTPLKTGLEAVWGVIQDIATNFGEVIEGLVSGFQRVASIGLAISRGQFRQAFNETRDLVNDGIGIFTEFGNRVVEAYQQGAEAGRELVELQIQLEERQNAMIVPLARMNREYQELRTLSGDTALTEEERLEAVREALEIQQRITDEQLGQLDMEIQILSLKQQQNDTSREEDRTLQELIARREDIERQAIRQNQNLTRRQSTLINAIEQRAEKERQAQEEAEERERLLAEQRELRLLKEGEDRVLREREIQLRLRELDAQNYEEEQEIRMERLELERDQRLLEIEREIEDEELRLQEIELINQEYQTGLTQIEKEQTDARIRLAELENQAKIELALEVANTFGAITRLLGEQTSIGKALGIASATIDTYVGANKALAQGGIFGGVAAAGIIATGLANVRQILSTKVPSIQGQPLGTPASSPINTPQLPSAQFVPQGIETVETVFPQQDLRVSVLESDITQAQSRVARVNESSTF